MGDLLANNLSVHDYYLLKWSSNNGGNLLSIRCEFIKYFDKRYCDDYIDYRLYDDEPSASLIGTILTEGGEAIQHNFDNPLYPYSRFHSAILYQNNQRNVGLFKVINIVSCMDDGMDTTFNSSPFAESQLGQSFIRNTPGVMEEGTLMWVDLNGVNNIMPALNQERAVQHHAADKLPLPEDIIREEIKRNLGNPQPQLPGGTRRRRGVVRRSRRRVVKKKKSIRVKK
jgi:hypothetical protein